MTESERLKDVQDRSRRIETRVTKICEAMGLDAGGLRPIWRDGTVIVPNMRSGFQDIIETIPAHWPREDEVLVNHKGVVIGSVFLPEQAS